MLQSNNNTTAMDTVQGITKMLKIEQQTLDDQSRYQVTL